MPAARTSRSNLLDHHHGLFRSSSLVTQVECIRGHHRTVYFIDIAGHGPFETAQVQYQSDKRHIIPLRQSAHDLFRIRHLRNPFGIDKTDRLHTPYARVDQAVYQFQFVFYTQQYRLALQSVPGTDVNDFNKV